MSVQLMRLYQINFNIVIFTTNMEVNDSKQLFAAEQHILNNAV